MTKEQITQKELDKIRAAAKDTTGGDWTYSVDSETGMAATLFSNFEGEEIDIAVFEEWDAEDSKEEMLANARFLSNAKSTILAMCDALEAKGKEIERMTLLYRNLSEKHNGGIDGVKLETMYEAKSQELWSMSYKALKPDDQYTVRQTFNKKGGSG